MASTMVFTIEMIISSTKTMVEATKKMVEAMIAMVEATHAIVYLTKIEALTTEMIFSVAQKMPFVPKKIVIVPDIMVSAVQNIISATRQMLSEAGKMRLAPSTMVCANLCRASIWPDQTGAGLPTIPYRRNQESLWRADPGLRNAQLQRETLILGQAPGKNESTSGHRCA